MSWEKSKENIQPLRQGRKVEALSQSLLHGDASKDNSEQLAQLKSTHLLKIKSALDLYDPLEPFVDYVKWYREVTPNLGVEYYQILEGCLEFFKNNKLSERYSKDPRYIHIWIAYADLYKEPQHIYEYMRSQEIGTTLALFYESWSRSVEGQGDYTLAETIVNEGVKLLAQPTKRLTQHLAELKARATRDKEVNGRVLPGTERDVLGQLSSHHVKVPSDRAGSYTQPSKQGLGLGVQEEGRNSRNLLIHRDAIGAQSQSLYRQQPLNPNTALPKREKLTQENTQRPTKWINAQIPSSGPVRPADPVEFAIHQDPKQMVTSTTTTTQVSKHYLKDRPIITLPDPLHIFKHRPSERRPEPHEVLRYPYWEVYPVSGGQDASIEEIRARRYWSEVGNDSGDDMEFTTCANISPHCLLSAQQQVEKISPRQPQNPPAIIRSPPAVFGTLPAGQAMKRSPDLIVPPCAGDNSAFLTPCYAPSFSSVGGVNKREVCHSVSAPLPSRQIGHPSAQLFENSSNPPAYKALSQVTADYSSKSDKYLHNTSILSRSRSFDEKLTDKARESPMLAAKQSITTPGTIRRDIPFNIGRDIRTTPQGMTRDIQTSDIGGTNKNILITPSDSRKVSFTTPQDVRIATAASVIKSASATVQELEKDRLVTKPGFQPSYTAKPKFPSNQPAPTFQIANSSISCLPNQLISSNRFTSPEGASPPEDTTMTLRTRMADRDILEMFADTLPSEKETYAPVQTIRVQKTLSFNIHHDNSSMVHSRQLDSSLMPPPSRTLLSYNTPAKGPGLEVSSDSSLFQQPTSTPMGPHKIPLNLVDVTGIQALEHTPTQKREPSDLFSKVPEDKKNIIRSPSEVVLVSEKDENRGGRHLTPMGPHKIPRNLENVSDIQALEHPPSQEREPSDLFAKIAEDKRNILPSPSEVVPASAREENRAGRHLSPINEGSDELTVSSSKSGSIDEGCPYVDPFNMSNIRKMVGEYMSQKQYERLVDRTWQAVPHIGLKRTAEFGDIHFKILKQIGTGGFANVYVGAPLTQEAIDLSPEERPALKVIMKQPSCIEYLIADRIQSELCKHKLPHLCASFYQPYSCIMYKNATILVSECYPHGTLLDLINRMKLNNTPKQGSSTYRFALEVLFLVETLHSIGIIHNDIKPDNFLLRSPDPITTQGRNPLGALLHLIDFGRSVDLSLFSKNVQFVGSSDTDTFELPCMREGKPYLHNSDSFGAAATIYCILTYEYPRIIDEPEKPGKFKLVKPIKSVSRRYSLIWDPLIYQLMNVSSSEAIGAIAEARSELEGTAQL